MKRSLRKRRWYRILFQRKYKIEKVQDALDNYSSRRIYLIKDIGQKAWLIQFKCPCGCNTIVNLNLIENASPRWRYFIDKKKRITIRPSVNRLVGCKSHFNIVDGKVFWI